MGGDSLCPHPIWRQNTVPARSAFTQSGRAVQTPGLCPYSIWRPREGHADFSATRFLHSTPGVGSVKNVIRIPSRCVALYVTGGGSGKEFGFSFLPGGEESAVCRAVSVRSPSVPWESALTFGRRSAHQRRGAADRSRSPRHPSRQRDACDQAR